jgi:Flp pilus assembly pilin Flp
MSETSRTKPRFVRGGDSEDGQALVEYALILALIMVVSIGALTALGTSIVGFLGLIQSQLGSIVAGS